MNILQKDITKELGLENIPEDKKEEIYLRISKIVYQNIMIRAVEILSEEQKDDLGKLLDEEVKSSEETNDNVLEFLRSSIENFDDIVSEEVVKFKEESINVMQDLKK